MPTMVNAAVILFILIMSGLALFQVALILGAPFGRFAWGGQHEVLPLRLRVGSVISLAIYALMVGVVLDQANRISLFPDAVSRVLGWIMFGYFILGIGMNAISRCKPERSVMVPTCAVLAGTVLVVLVG